MPRNVTTHRPKINHKNALIIGAWPAGLTAAYELLEKTNIKPIIFEMSNDIGGISFILAAFPIIKLPAQKKVAQNK